MAKMQRLACQAWERYLKIWKEWKGWKLFLFYMLHYTLLFVVIQRGVFDPFHAAGKSFIWSKDWTQDGLSQHFSNMVYVSQTVRDGIQRMLKGDGWTFPLYDFRRGVMKTAFEMEPIQWLAIFWPWDKIDTLYDVLVLTRYYLIGVSFSILGFYFAQKPIPIMIGALSYTFCGFSIYAGVRHPFFMCPMILLPLLIIGAEKVVKGERAWFFSGIVFLSLISSLYFSCMLAILIVIYILVRYCYTSKNAGSWGFGGLIGRTTLWGGTGVLLGGIAWAPTLLQMAGTGRIGREVGIAFQYVDSYYEKYLTGFVVIPGTLGYWTCLGFSILAIPAVLLLLFDKRTAVKSLKLIFFVLTGMACLPIAAYVMSGFNTYSNRWIFAYALCVSVILVVELPTLLTVERRQILIVGIGTLAYIALCYFGASRKYYHEEPLVFLVLTLLVIFLCYWGGSWGTSKILPICLLITCISVNYSAFMMYDPTQRNYVSEFTDKGAAYKALEAGQYTSLGCSQTVQEDDSLFYVLGNNVISAEVNSSYYRGLNGLSFFSSSIYNSYHSLKNGFEVGQRDLNILDPGLDGRTPMMSLANVKYYALRETGGEIKPYGMKEIDRIKNGKNTDIILENPYALSVGYTYDNWQSEDEFLELPALGRQETVFQAVVLKEAPRLETLTKKNTDFSSRDLSVEIVSEDGLSWKDGKLNVKKENATMKLSFEGVANEDTYLRVVNLDLTSGSSARTWYLTVDTDSTKTRTRFAADGYVYSNGAKTQLIYLGNSEDGFDSCTLTFPKKGTFILDDLEIWCQPMDHYAEQIETLRAEALENVETNWQGLTGTISTTKDKFLCFSIPYDKGWTVYVDGVKARLVQANIGFMGVELPAGDHDVELKYWPPGLTIGIALSCIGLVGVVGFGIYTQKGKRRGKTEE